jgi:hypothetical protein
MKTTLAIPDSIFRRAKAKAAEQGISLRQFVTDAVAEKLEAESPDRAKAILKLGGLRHLRKESARINRLIEQEFERIEPTSPASCNRPCG